MLPPYRKTCLVFPTSCKKKKPTIFVSDCYSHEDMCALEKHVHRYITQLFSQLMNVSHMSPRMTAIRDCYSLEMIEIWCHIESLHSYPI